MLELLIYDRCFEIKHVVLIPHITSFGFVIINFSTGTRRVIKIMALGNKSLKDPMAMNQMGLLNFHFPMFNDIL